MVVCLFSLVVGVLHKAEHIEFAILANRLSQIRDCDAM